MTVRGRLLLIDRVVGNSRPVAHVAKELGVSRQCAHRWLRRFRAEGADGMADRSPRPRSSPTRTAPSWEAVVVAARAQLLRGDRGARPDGGTPAAGFFAQNGIPMIERVLSENTSAYRKSIAFKDAVAQIGAEQRFCKQHCPWTNGKVERLNRTLAGLLQH